MRTPRSPPHLPSLTRFQSKPERKRYGTLVAQCNRQNSKNLLCPSRDYLSGDWLNGIDLYQGCLVGGSLIDLYQKSLIEVILISRELVNFSRVMMVLHHVVQDTAHLQHKQEV
jgi:hypothetical protein